MDEPSTVSGKFLDATSTTVTAHRGGSSKFRACAMASLLIIFACIYLQAKAEDNCRDIGGIVIDSEGKPIDHAPVVASTQTGDATFSVFTKADGSYTLPKLPVGI